jgi:saccharopine dehydrogenase-like NADP-dependent oxidoreductase
MVFEMKWMAYLAKSFFTYKSKIMPSMHKVLLFGAGKSSSVLIDFLQRVASEGFWEIAIADADETMIRAKTGDDPRTIVVGIDILDAEKRMHWIQWSDLVISLMPPHLHLLIANDCLQAEKSLLTASYVDDAMRTLDNEIKSKGLLFLCEMGLDPGIDHMSAMELIDRLQKKGAKINGFSSHCGGLVAPESDDNPWHYKISWNPRNVVMAGKSGAIYLDESQNVELPYSDLFSKQRPVNVATKDIDLSLAYYPNRNSLPYIQLYGLEGVQKFIRTTLRYPAFISGWNNLIELRLTDETLMYATDGMKLADFFKLHFQQVGFNHWLDKQLEWRFKDSNDLIKAMESSTADEEKLIMSKRLAETMESANELLKQLFFLGMEDNQTLINLGNCSAADVLQCCLEKKLLLNPTDLDMVVMQHEIGYELDGKQYLTTSSLVVKGKDNIHTAMAKTVGLPLGIAARLILDKQIQVKGLQIPTLSEIYDKVLPELAKEGIEFWEKTDTIS